jgi:hypothetical protein
VIPVFHTRSVPVYFNRASAAESNQQNQEWKFDRGVEGLGCIAKDADGEPVGARGDDDYERAKKDPDPGCGKVAAQAAGFSPAKSHNLRNGGVHLAW